MIRHNPQFFYFVIPNFSIGGTLSYQSISRGDFSDSSIGIGPAIVYFFWEEKSSSYPFLGVSYIYTKDEDSFIKNDIRFLGGAADNGAHPKKMMYNNAVNKIQ
jgi:hypothetical protein